MKKRLKTFLIYLGVLILAFLATVVFCAAFLFFYREGNIFGIQYIKRNELIYARENEDMSDIQKIEVYGNNFDINIKLYHGISDLAGVMRNKVFGYAKKSKAQASFTLEYDEVNKTAVFTVKEPKGWLNKSECYIEIALPSDLAENDIDLFVNGNKMDVTIGDDINWELNTVEVDVAKGDVVLTNLTVLDNMSIDIGSGIFYVDDKCSTNGSIVATVELGSGTVNLGRINSSTFNLSSIKINKLKTGKIGILKAGELITSKNINGGGRIEVKEVGFVDFSSLDTDIIIDNITNPNITSRIEMSGNGDVSVNNSSAYLEIYGHNGNINVKIAERGVTASSNQGDIKITHAMGQVSVETKYGTANIAFDDTILDYDETNKYRSLIAVTKNGHIYSTGVQNAYVTATEKGRISLRYDKVIGENIISSNIGAVNIVVPNPDNVASTNQYAFNLKVTSQVNTDIKVGAAGSLGQVDTDTRADEFVNIYGKAGNNNLIINTATGPIKIRSADLVGY